ETWKHIRAETDDDHEWLPNPRQKGILPGMRVTDAMIDAWLGLVGGAESLLSGKKLLPLGFAGGDEGLNVRKMFTDPHDLDAEWETRYREKGVLTDPNAVWRLIEVFGSGFLVY